MQVQSFILGLALLNWFTFGFRFDVRKPTKAELKPVAKIMSDSFDDSPNIFVKWYSELNYEEMLKDRFVRLVEMDSRKHTMFISASNVMDSATVVSGFIEVGLLVLPTNRVPLDGSYNIDSIGIIDGVRDSEVCYEAGDVGPQNMQQTLDAGAGLEGNINADVVSNKSSARYPTIGNVAVRQDYRGKGIARALLSHIVRVSLKFSYPISC